MTPNVVANAAQKLPVLPAVFTLASAKGLGRPNPGEVAMPPVEMALASDRSGVLLKRSLVPVTKAPSPTIPRNAVALLAPGARIISATGVSATTAVVLVVKCRL